MPQPRSQLVTMAIFIGRLKVSDPEGGGSAEPRHLAPAARRFSEASDHGRGRLRRWRARWRNVGGVHVAVVASVRIEHHQTVRAWDLGLNDLQIAELWFRAERLRRRLIEAGVLAGIR